MSGNISAVQRYLNAAKSKNTKTNHCGSNSDYHHQNKIQSSENALGQVSSNTTRNGTTARPTRYDAAATSARPSRASESRIGDDKSRGSTLYTTRQKNETREDRCEWNQQVVNVDIVDANDDAVFEDENDLPPDSSPSRCASPLHMNPFIKKWENMNMAASASSSRLSNPVDQSHQGPASLLRNHNDNNKVTSHGANRFSARGSKDPPITKTAAQPNSNDSSPRMSVVDRSHQNHAPLRNRNDNRRCPVPGHDVQTKATAEKKSYNRSPQSSPVHESREVLAPASLVQEQFDNNRETTQDASLCNNVGGSQMKTVPHRHMSFNRSPKGNPLARSKGLMSYVQEQMNSNQNEAGLAERLPTEQSRIAARQHAYKESPSPLQNESQAFRGAGSAAQRAPRISRRDQRGLLSNLPLRRPAGRSPSSSPSPTPSPIHDNSAFTRYKPTTNAQKISAAGQTRPTNIPRLAPNVQQSEELDDAGDGFHEEQPQAKIERYAGKNRSEATNYQTINNGITKKYGMSARSRHMNFSARKQEHVRVTLREKADEGTLSTAASSPTPPSPVPFVLPTQQSCVQSKPQLPPPPLLASPIFPSPPQLNRKNPFEATKFMGNQEESSHQNRVSPSPTAHMRYPAASHLLHKNPPPNNNSILQMPSLSSKYSEDGDVEQSANRTPAASAYHEESRSSYRSYSEQRGDQVQSKWLQHTTSAARGIDTRLAQQRGLSEKIWDTGGTTRASGTAEEQYEYDQQQNRENFESASPATEKKEEDSGPPYRSSSLQIDDGLHSNRSPQQIGWAARGTDSRFASQKRTYHRATGRADDGLSENKTQQNSTAHDFSASTAIPSQRHPQHSTQCEAQNITTELTLKSEAMRQPERRAQSTAVESSTFATRYRDQKHLQANRTDKVELARRANVTSEMQEEDKISGISPRNSPIKQTYTRSPTNVGSAEVLSEPHLSVKNRISQLWGPAGKLKAGKDPAPNASASERQAEFSPKGPRRNEFRTARDTKIAPAATSSQYRPDQELPLSKESASPSRRNCLTRDAPSSTRQSPYHAAQRLSAVNRQSSAFAMYHTVEEAVVDHEIHHDDNVDDNDESSTSSGDSSTTVSTLTMPTFAGSFASRSHATNAISKNKWKESCESGHVNRIPQHAPEKQSLSFGNNGPCHDTHAAPRIPPRCRLHEDSSEHLGIESRQHNDNLRQKTRPAYSSYFPLANRSHAQVSQKRAEGVSDVQKDMDPLKQDTIPTTNQNGKARGSNFGLAVSRFERKNVLLNEQRNYNKAQEGTNHTIREEPARSPQIKYAKSEDAQRPASSRFAARTSAETASPRALSSSPTKRIDRTMKLAQNFQERYKIWNGEPATNPIILPNPATLTSTPPRMTLTSFAAIQKKDKQTASGDRSGLEQAVEEAITHKNAQRFMKTKMNGRGNQMNSESVHVPQGKTHSSQGGYQTNFGQSVRLPQQHQKWAGRGPALPTTSQEASPQEQESNIPRSFHDRTEETKGGSQRLGAPNQVPQTRTDESAQVLQQIMKTDGRDSKTQNESLQAAQSAQKSMTKKKALEYRARRMRMNAKK
jgi:hypothetical protein